MSKDKVLILGADARSLLAVVRSLGRQGCEVHTCWVPSDSIALRSKYIHENHTVQNYAAGSDRWLVELEQLLERERFDLVVPCDDPSILPLQKERERLSGFARLEILSPGVQKVVESKQRSYELASGLGVSVPKSAYVANESELDSALRLLIPPFVLKPVSSFTIQDTRSRNEVVKASCVDVAMRVGRDILQSVPLQVQENVVGGGTGVEFLASNGEVLVSFQHMRVHEPLYGGGGSYRKSIRVDQRMLEDTKRMVRALEYDGVGMVEFKWDVVSGRYVFMEINGRFWGSLPLAVASGVDFPAYLYRYRMFGERQFPQEFKVGIYSRYLLQDINWLRENAAANRSDPALMTLPWPKVAGEVVHIFSGCERIDSLAWDDPSPFVSEMWQLGLWVWSRFGNLAGKVAWRVRALNCARRIERKKVKALLRAAKHIEFVCYGNICRSPFAEAVCRGKVRELGLGITVGSSGFHDVIGRASPSQAVEVSQGRGIDLSGHKSRLLTCAAVEKADVIFVFDQSNLSQMVREFPSSSSKTFLIGALGAESQVEICDPYGGGVEVFRERYARIEKNIDDLVRLLRKVSSNDKRSCAGRKTETLGVICVRSFDEFKQLEKGWTVLFDRGESGNIFMSWQWQYAWARQYLDEKQLFVLCVVNGNSLIGLAPCYIRSERSRWGGRYTEIRWIGTEEVFSSYLDILVAPGWRAEVLKRLYTYLFDGSSGGWDVLTWSEMPGESPTIDMWRKLFDEDGKVCEAVASGMCPVVDTRRGWEEIRRRIGRNERYNLSRKFKYLSSFGTVKFERYTGASDVVRYFGEFSRLHQARWVMQGHGGCFESKRFEAFHRDIIRLFSLNNQVVLDFMTVNGERIAAIYGFLYRGTYSFYLPAMDPKAYPKASPGILLLAHIIERAAADGVQTFDLLQGFNNYKLVWSNRMRRSVTVQGYNKTWRAGLLRLQDGIIQAAKVLIR